MSTKHSFEKCSPLSISSRVAWRSTLSLALTLQVRSQNMFLTVFSEGKEGILFKAKQVNNCLALCTYLRAGLSFLLGIRVPWL